MTEDEMIGWHHRLNGHGFGCTLGVGDRQGGLACCDSLTLIFKKKKKKKKDKCRHPIIHTI